MKTHKCPNCGSSVKSNISSCPYCSTAFDIDEEEKVIEIDPNKNYTTMTPVELASELNKIKKHLSKIILRNILLICGIFTGIILLTGFVLAVNGNDRIEYTILICAILAVFFYAIVTLMQLLGNNIIFKISKIIKLLNNGEAEKAYTYAKARMKQNTNSEEKFLMKAIAISIAFYINKDYNYAYNRLCTYTFFRNLDKYKYMKCTDIFSKASLELGYTPPEIDY